MNGCPPTSLVFTVTIKNANMNRTFRNGSAIVCPSKHKFRTRKLRDVLCDVSDNGQCILLVAGITIYPCPL